MTQEILFQAQEIMRASFESLVPGLYAKLPSLIVLTIAIAVYAFIIYKFYRFIAKRDVFGFDIHKYLKDKYTWILGVYDTALSLFKYGIIFPVIVFIWFAGFSILLFFMAKELATPEILLISVAFVAAIRITSYYTEDLSKDLAKLIPLVILGTMLIQPNFFSLELVQARILGLTTFVSDILVYFVFIVLVEWILRILLWLKHLIFGISIDANTVIRKPIPLPKKIIKK